MIGAQGGPAEGSGSLRLGLTGLGRGVLPRRWSVLKEGALRGGLRGVAVPNGPRPPTRGKPKWNGQVGRAGHRFEATLPLRGTTMDLTRIRELVHTGVLDYISPYPPSGGTPKVM